MEYQKNRKFGEGSPNLELSFEEEMRQIEIERERLQKELKFLEVREFRLRKKHKMTGTVYYQVSGEKRPRSTNRRDREESDRPRRARSEGAAPRRDFSDRPRRSRALNSEQGERRFADRANRSFSSDRGKREFGNKKYPARRQPDGSSARGSRDNKRHDREK